MTSARFGSLRHAAPFWMSLLSIPVLWIGALWGGWWVALMPLWAWYCVGALDALTGLNTENPDPLTPEDHLFWYRLITLIWAPVQIVTQLSILWYVTSRATHLGTAETIVLIFGLGVMGGTTGIVYAHELVHQRNRLERWLGDILLASVLYSHFRSEHLLIHHRYVGTPKDAVTARYNEGFHRFFARVLPGQVISAFRAEAALLARKSRPWYDRRNPHWRYWALQTIMLVLVGLLTGPLGLLLFVWQALVAAWQLELTNYIEHYGLTRRHLGDGRYEHVLPRHSWNAAHRVSNWLLINLQRHSDHHYKPDRRFPLLQTYAPDEAPQLPLGYPIMAMAAMVPPLWRRIMNPKVRAWRKQFYPDITDWAPYTRATNPMPR